MTLNHEQACAELRKAARLLDEGKISLDEWCDSVHRILRARGA